ncbi:hypothetical protein DSL92_04165 [Billgrantia gudaonensis]|uniref:Uncharacterized protein n=1 Tax=Billgrantia gudaonensis TaxID=376427 RepID=A0A432JK87_9GAMM|nr:hypothetical protein DSL92_04165 [Halomonas gudaonensis]
MPISTPGRAAVQPDHLTGWLRLRAVHRHQRPSPSYVSMPRSWSLSDASSVRRPTPLLATRSPQHSRKPSTTPSSVRWRSGDHRIPPSHRFIRHLEHCGLAGMMHSLSTVIPALEW